MNQSAINRAGPITTGRPNMLTAEAASEKAFALRAFVVISVLFVLAWVLTG